MITPSKHTMTMGPTFSQWEHLTNEYRQGLEALRRGDTSGSKQMMRLAREIQLLGLRCSDPLHMAQPTDWSASQMEALAPQTVRPSVGQRFARIFSTMQA
ncbi:hypothetical protein ACSFA2_24500 [Variovorax sp. LT2P21]|uniref:hypothetical protein n=1 Tax=Variovorax sp. LT2P21 TaxID=3443731 RepID=UPI003F4685E3